MANIIDEVSKETMERMENTTKTIFEFLRDFLKIMEQRERANMGKALTDRADHKELYNEELNDLTKAEQKLYEKYKTLYNEARESGDYKNILPFLHERIKGLVEIEINPKTDLYKGFESSDLALFLKQYVDEYEDLSYDDLFSEVAEGVCCLSWNTLNELTDFEEEVLNPMIEEIQKEQEQSKKKIAEVKESIFGTDTREALENCNGLLWNDHDTETIEEWLNTPFDNEKWEVKNGLEIAVGEWLNNLNNEKENDEYETEHTFIKELAGTDATLTDDEFNKLCDLIVDDIYNYHEQEYENRKDALINSILKDEKATMPVSHFDNEIDIDER